jgi:ABC-type multidrug transport system ATPase subunit
MTTIIQTQKLTKTYGSHRGIVDIDLEIAEGEVFGFLGPNGAGKTRAIPISTGSVSGCRALCRSTATRIARAARSARRC